MAPVLHIKSEAEWDSTLAKAAQEGKAVIVDFTASWCGPCRMIGPYFAQLSETDEYPNIVFVKVDVDEVEAVAAACNVSAMPTFQVFKAKAKADELVGASKEKLLALVVKHNAK